MVSEYIDTYDFVHITRARYIGNNQFSIDINPLLHSHHVLAMNGKIKKMHFGSLDDGCE